MILKSFLFRKTNFQLSAAPLLVTFLAVFTFSISAQAQTPPKTACDPEVMDAMEARAILEAQREVVQNQNLIFKPDSVLQYTCFDQAIGTVGANTEANFSEDNDLGDPAGLDDDSLDKALGMNDSSTKTPGGMALKYVEKNFVQESYLNGRRGGRKYTKYDGGGYACSEMRDIWQKAKGIAFIDDKAKDGFYDFPYYATKQDQIRTPNIPLAVIPTDDSNTVTIDKAMDEAFNKRKDRYTLSGADEKGVAMANSTKYDEDTVSTHLEKILPPGIGPATKCEAAIPTGIKVKRIGGAEFDEKICPNPGCAPDAYGVCK